VILAGGVSSRFGGLPKGLALVAGSRVLDRVAKVLRSQTDGLLLVANDASADSWLPGVRRVVDVQPGRGPLAGIHAALLNAATAVLVVAWDMPFVAEPLLAELRRRGKSGRCAVVPESSAGRLEPTCAFYAPACASEIERWLSSGRSGAAAFLDQCPGVERVSVTEVERFDDPSRLFFSINTPAALQQAEALAALS
jgi:molybdopterin-guanine dinucleotide biosynthesis protein A